MDNRITAPATLIHVLVLPHHPSLKRSITKEGRSTWARKEFRFDMLILNQMSSLACRSLVQDIGLPSCEPHRRGLSSSHPFPAYRTPLYLDVERLTRALGSTDELVFTMGNRFFNRYDRLTPLDNASSGSENLVTNFILRSAAMFRFVGRECQYNHRYMRLTQ